MAALDSVIQVGIHNIGQYGSSMLPYGTERVPAGQRRTSETLPIMTYNLRGNVIQVTDEAGRITDFARDRFNQKNQPD